MTSIRKARRRVRRIERYAQRYYPVIFTRPERGGLYWPLGRAWYRWMSRYAAAMSRLPPSR